MVDQNNLLLWLLSNRTGTNNDKIKEYEILLNELRKHNPELLDKQHLLAISKCDMLDEELKEEIKQELPEGVDSVFISSVAQTGLMELKDKIWKMLN